MAAYYVNKNAQPNGDHEVHHIVCSRMPVAPNAQYLGDFTTCREAVARARGLYLQSNGCCYCSPDCHTG